jgi:hypothetical protein
MNQLTAFGAALLVAATPVGFTVFQHVGHVEKDAAPTAARAPLPSTGAADAERRRMERLVAESAARAAAYAAKRAAERHATEGALASAQN